jgi:hypothetical protein
VIHNPLQKYAHPLPLSFSFQLIYGGFMAGMKAAVVGAYLADINGAIIPASQWWN